METSCPQNELDRPIEIAEGIYWVGFHERHSNLRCNPYLIVEEGEALLIDAGSRPDFPFVMMKILQSGIAPEQIQALVYHHIDPDLCGSMSNMVDICNNPDLIILSDPDNNVFLSYYIEREKRSLLRSLQDCDSELTLGQRKLTFIKTPYAHSAGSFVTYDSKTKTLFSSDLFGNISSQWQLFAFLEEECRACKDHSVCVLQKEHCLLADILAFHRKNMPSGKALRHAMQSIENLDIEIIAPQHGSLFTNRQDIRFLIQALAELEGVGIDAF